MKKYTYLLIFGFFLISCSEKEEIITKESPTPEFYTSTNSYDSDGEFHNDCLDELATETGFPFADSQDYWDFTVDYYERDYSLTMTPNNYSVAADELNDYLDTSLSQVATDLYTDALISSTVKDALVNIYNTMANESLYTSNGNNFSVIVDELDDLEVALLGGSYSPQDEEVILMAIAVARHSAAYWSAAIDNPTHPYYDYLEGATMEAKPKRKFWRILRTIVADAAGVAVGIGTAGGAGIVVGVYASAFAG